jgi:hypothetical protein
MSPPKSNCGKLAGGQISTSVVLLWRQQLLQHVGYQHMHAESIPKITVNTNHMLKSPAQRT